MPYKKSNFPLSPQQFLLYFVRYTFSTSNFTENLAKGCHSADLIRLPINHGHHTNNTGHEQLPFCKCCTSLPRLAQIIWKKYWLWQTIRISVNNSYVVFLGSICWWMIQQIASTNIFNTCSGNSPYKNMIIVQQSCSLKILFFIVSPSTQIIITVHDRFHLHIL
jgi:hypothetical protein